MNRSERAGTPDPDPTANERSGWPGWSNLLLLVVSLLCSLLVSEWMVRTFTRFPISKWTHRIKHDALGYVLSPELADVDRWGFRNPRVPVRSDLVIIGDSHTYGNFVRASEAWPYQLGRRMGRSVYSMAVPGFGILQYYYLYQRARDRLDPRVVILGLNPVNDFQAQSCLLFNKVYWRRQLREGLLEVGACREKAERFEPWTAAIFGGFRALRQMLTHWVGEPLWHRFLLETGLFEDAYYRLSRGEKSVVVSDYLLTIHARESRLKDPEVRTLYENGRRVLRWMARDARRHGIRLGVVILPSKGRVSREWARREGILVPASFRRKLAVQEEMRRTLMRFLRRHDFAVEDALDPMVETLDRAAASWDPLYRIHDGHPDEPRAHRAYARAGRRLLESLGSPGPSPSTER